MSSIRLAQNPGIGGLDELTAAEELVIQQIAGLGDPNADRILFWDDSAGSFQYLSVGTGLSITNTTISATAASLDGSGTTNELAYWVDSDTLGALAVATYPSLTELSYVKGVTSAIQTQVNAKAPSTAPTFATSITGSYLTASEILITDASKNIVSAPVATYPSLTELTYVKGVTSAIQTQLNAKQASDAQLTSIAGLSYAGNALKVIRVNAGETDFELATPGSGDVVKVGTPANNQIGVWTGDGTIEGDSSLTWDGTSFNIATAKNFQIAGGTVLSDAAGTLTLSGIDAIDATTEATIEAAIDTLANLTSIQGRTVTLADAGANAIFGWDDTAGAYENLSQAEARTVLGLGTAAYVATDLSDLNEATIEAAIDTLANLTSIQSQTVTLSAPLTVPADPGADRLFFWDDSETATAWLTPGNGLTITTTSIAVDSASTTVDGIVELAIDTEVTAGTDATRAVTPDSLAGSNIFGRKAVSIQVTDGTTDVTTGDGKAYITIPESLNGMNLVRAQATVVTAGTTNATTIMIHNKTDAADMLSGAISIASAGTVGTVGTIAGASDDVATNDILRIDVDSVSTTAPKGLMVVLEFQLP